MGLESSSSDSCEIIFASRCVATQKMLPGKSLSRKRSLVLSQSTVAVEICWLLKSMLGVGGGHIGP